MEQEKLVVLESKKRVRYAVIQEEDIPTQLTEEKIKKVEALLKLLIKQSISQTMEEYHAVLKEELLQSEEKLEGIMKKNWEEDHKRWKKLEEHFTKVDKIIREKQKQGKRKKHSIF